MSKRKKALADATAQGDAPRFRKDMLVADAVDLHPGAKDVLLSYGLPCAECIVSLHETLAEGCAPLGLKVDEVVGRLNQLS